MIDRGGVIAGYKKVWGVSGQMVEGECDLRVVDSCTYVVHVCLRLHL